MTVLLDTSCPRCRSRHATPQQIDDAGNVTVARCDECDLVYPQTTGERAA